MKLRRFADPAIAQRILAAAAIVLLAGCNQVRMQDFTVGGAPGTHLGGIKMTAYDVTTSKWPWAVQHRGTCIDSSHVCEVEDPASIAEMIESTIGPVGSALKIVQPTANVGSVP